MSERTIQAIAFDFGNTLCPWDEDQYRQVTRSTLGAICACGSRHDIDPAYEVFSRIRSEESARNLPRLMENDLVGILQRAAGEILGRELDRSELDEVLKAHTAAFVNVCTAPDGLLPMLERLSQEYKLAVASNYPLPRCVRLAVASTGIAEYMRATVVSGDLGVIKPSPRVFDEVLAALDLPAESVLFVGDDPVADIVGACASGMPCVRVADSATAGNSETMARVFGVHLRKCLARPELRSWREAKPLAVLGSVLELEDWLKEQAA